MASSWRITNTARTGGRIRNAEFFREIGRRGGERVREAYGSGFYEEIGRRGGKERSRVLGREGYVRLGRRGGERTRDLRGSAFYEEIGRRGGKTRARMLGPEGYAAMGRKGGQSARHSPPHRRQSKHGVMESAKRIFLESQNPRKQNIKLRGGLSPRSLDIWRW